MDLLHLCSYYIGNQLHKKLFWEMSKNNINQHIYVPINNEDFKNKNIFIQENAKFYYDHILQKKDRILFKSKIKKQAYRVTKLIDLSNIDVIHAHTLYSDGGTAYLLKKKYDIPYIVSIRSTDIIVFYKYFIHIRHFIYKVLSEAEYIIFISEAYKKKVMKMLPSNIAKRISNKILVIPNGIDNAWLENMHEEPREKDNSTNLLFTGSLDANKNLITVLKVLQQLNGHTKKYFLNIAGNGSKRKQLESFVNINDLNDRVKFHGHVSKNELIRLMDLTDIFILPSIHETFGISYIEAMARGVPVLYTENEGIDGFFEEGEVGYSIKPLDPDDIIHKLKLIENRYKTISVQCIKNSKRFNRGLVVKEYIDHYEKVISTL